ncbi:uncharacterized protein LOC110058419 [Orbicella faveolata]|uniref:uncharacterized protein LOC110058419 n=1 Tax=Orbicella faveolata TaxID=48498 RepID=UPI0009E62938|nr:uncharacterized protein LOC110058419 [Orbicella faveolata]
MALLRKGHKLMLHTARQSSIRCFRSSSVVLSGGTQSEFTGLENCFIWDDKHGFGFNKDGEVVIVRPNASTSPTVTESPVFSSKDLNIPSPDLMEQDPGTGDGQMNTG